MHNLRAPLNKLLKKGAKWEWLEVCRKAFDKIKNILTLELSQTYYNPKQEIIMASDASEYGISAVILHKFKDGNTNPVAHASRTLLPAEKKYSQIEKESLAIIHACKKSHKYISIVAINIWFKKGYPYAYGKPVTTIGNHFIEL